ncbi:MAG: hypothetical protein ACJAT2_000713 [Bacteriovoracaceae bacterium]
MKIGWILLSLIPLIAFGYDPSTQEIAQVESVDGTAVVYNNGKTIQYLKPKHKLQKNIMIVTRNKSSLTLRFWNGEKLVLGPNSKITIGKVLINLKKGRLSYDDPTGSYHGYKFKFGDSRIIYNGPQLRMSKGLGNDYITPLNNTRIKRFRLSEKGKVQKDLEIPDLTSFFNTASVDDIPLPKEEVSIGSKTNSTLEVEDIFANENPVPNSSDEVEDIFSSSPSPEAGVPVKGVLLSELFAEEDKQILDLYDIDWKLSIGSTYYFNPPPEESNKDIRSFHLDLKLDFKDKVELTPKSNFNYSGWFEFSNRKEVFNGALSITGRETKKKLVVANEYFWQKSYETFDFTLGKKIIRYGKGMIVSPADRLSPSDNIVPVKSQRLGIFVGSLDYYFGTSKLSFYLVPYINSTKSPHQYSRWSTRNDGTNYEIESLWPSGFDWENTQNLLKFETTLKGYDFFVAFFNGANTDAVIKNNITSNGNNAAPSFIIQQEHVPVSHLSAGFSTTFGGLEVHGEFLKQNAKEGKDDSYTQTMAGFRYSFDQWPRIFGLDQIDVIMEYIKESINQPITFPFTLFSSIQSRNFKNNLVGSFNFQVSDKTSYNFGFNIDNENSGKALLLGAAYKINIGQLYIRMETYSGEEESLFGKWDQNDNLAIEFKKDF